MKVPKFTLAGGSEGMLSREILKLNPLKSLETCILLVIFTSSTLSRRATKLHKKRHFA